MKNRLDRINSLNEDLLTNKIEPIPSPIFDTLKARVTYMEISYSIFYITKLIYFGFTNETEYDVHSHVASLEENIKTFKWLKEKNVEPELEAFFNKSKDYEAMLACGKLMETVVLFNTIVFEDLNAKGNWK